MVLEHDDESTGDAGEPLAYDCPSDQLFNQDIIDQAAVGIPVEAQSNSLRILDGNNNSPYYRFRTGPEA